MQDGARLAGGGPPLLCSDKMLILAKEPYTRHAARRRRRIKWKRLLLWGFALLAALIAALAGGSYLWLRGVVSEASGGAAVAAAKDVLDNKPPAATLSLPETPQGMNLLVLGSDKRSTGSETYGRSDTLMLVHVDPTKSFMSVLSLPRDLRLEVPGHGFQKINAAYAFGGAALAIETAQNLTGVDVDHYVEIDLGAFEDMTTSIGGVYVDVDRRYYYDGLDYENIKLAPGYQLLSGATALDYVRFRHDQNTDFGRLERQQRFLRAVREQAMGWDLAFKLPSLVKSLFKNVSTEMSTAEVIKLAYWVVNLRGTQIKQVALPGDIKTVSGVSYVVSSDKSVQEAVRSFLSPPTTAKDEPLSASAANGAGADSTTRADSTTGISGSLIVSIEASGGVTGALPSADSILDCAKWRTLASGAGFVLQGPTYLPEGYMCAERRLYEIPTADGAKPAMNAIYRNGKTEQYLGIMETTWLTAPAASPGESVEHGGVTFTIVGIDGKVDRIWWKTDGVLSWVSNTLFHGLSREELLAVAQSMVPVPAN
jgi:LCP family protein required for cell wall assembly